MTKGKLLIGVTFSALIFFICCNDYPRNKSFAEIPTGNIRKGDALAKKYCQSCHQFPEPSLLDAKSWEEGVLPNMGPFLGIFKHQFTQYPSGINDRNLDSNFYPRQPVLTPAEWQHIIDYYTATSPDSLPEQLREKPVAAGLPLFEARAVSIPSVVPTTCYVKIDTSGRIIFADYGTGNILKLNAQLQLVDSFNANGAIVHIDYQPGNVILCDIGQMNPNNAQLGSLHRIRADAAGKWRTDTTSFINGLARPVQVTTADLDGNKLPDYITCEFGFMTGSLSWFQNTGNNKFRRHVLRPFPGAIQVYVRDENGDGLSDLWVLFSQGEEGVFLFTNKGNAQFEQRQVLRFPPSYGSTFFELVDFNKDGHNDIVYTCGDNADYSPVLKPYHGVYVFLNKGNNEFTRQYFFPINGCYKALARDYDGDGDLDIAAIAFFADYEKQPLESFVYLENQQGSFQPRSFPEATTGRWLTMDAGDLDHDGKIDLVLGNFSKAPAIMRSNIDWTTGPPVLLLRNTGKTDSDSSLREAGN